MGKYFVDQYSYLHFASGIVAYFWGLSFGKWIFLHALFEIVENTPFGIYFINNYFTLWPGGKPVSDSFINSLGDNFFSFLGWLSAYYIDYFGTKYKWYIKHP